MIDHLPIKQGKFSWPYPRFYTNMVLASMFVLIGALVPFLETKLSLILAAIAAALSAFLLAGVRRVEGNFVISLAVCMSLGYTFPVTLGFLPPIQATFYVAFACLTTLLLISGHRVLDGLTVPCVPLLPQFIAYILALSLSVIFALVPAVGFTYLVHALMHAFAFYVGLFCLTKRSNQQAFATVLAVGAVFSSLLGWCQRFWPDQFMAVYAIWNPVPELMEFADQIKFWGRSTSIWGNPSAFSTFMNIAWPVSLGMALVSSSWKKVFFGLSLTIIFSGIVIANVRTDFVGLLVGMTYLSFRLHGRYLRKKYIVFTGIFLLVLLLFVKPTGIVQESLYGRLRFENPWDLSNALGRTIMVQEHFQQFSRSPFTGVGLRNSQIISDQDSSSLLNQGVSPHNYYTGMLAEAGIIGFLTLIWLLVSSFTVKPKRCLQTYLVEDQIMITAFTTSNVILLVTSLAQNPFWAWQFGLLFWNLRGAAVGLKFQAAEKIRQGG
jgi:hypothetical protein